MEAQKIKSAMQQLYQLCEMMEEKTNFRESLGVDSDTTLTNILRVNVICYLAYLAASDGVISWKESRFIGEILDICMTPSKLNEIIQDHNIYSTEFEEDPPLILQICVAIDNAVYESGASMDLELGHALFELYRFLTVSIVEANGRTTETMDANEEEDAQTYLAMMQNYIDENTKKHHTDIIVDIDKKRKRKDEEDDDTCFGVRAPQRDKKNAGGVKAPRKKM